MCLFVIVCNWCVICLSVCILCFFYIVKYSNFSIQELWCYETSVNVFRTIKHSHSSPETNCRRGNIIRSRCWYYNCRHSYYCYCSTCYCLFCLVVSIIMPSSLGDGALSFTLVHPYICTSINFCQRLLGLLLLDWFDITSQALSGWVVMCHPFSGLSSLSQWHIFSMLIWYYLFCNTIPCKTWPLFYWKIKQRYTKRNHLNLAGNWKNHTCKFQTWVWPWFSPEISVANLNQLNRSLTHQGKPIKKNHLFDLRYNSLTQVFRAFVENMIIYKSQKSTVMWQ